MEGVLFCANVYFFNCKTLGQKTVSADTLGQKYIVALKEAFKNNIIVLTLHNKAPGDCPNED